MKSFVLATTAAAMVLAGAGIAAAQAVVITPEQETRIRTYVTEQKVAPVTLPGGTVAIGTKIPQTVELRTVPGIDKYRVAVVGERTLVVDPATYEVVRIIEKN